MACLQAEIHLTQLCLAQVIFIIPDNSKHDYYNNNPCSCMCNGLDCSSARRHKGEASCSCSLKQDTISITVLGPALWLRGAGKAKSMFLQDNKCHNVLGCTEINTIVVTGSIACSKMICPQRSWINNKICSINVSSTPWSSWRSRAFKAFCIWFVIREEIDPLLISVTSLWFLCINPECTFAPLKKSCFSKPGSGTISWWRQYHPYSRCTSVRKHVTDYRETRERHGSKI